MSATPDGHNSLLLLDELRAARVHTARCIFLAVQYLNAAHATAQAHALPYPLPPIAPLQAALDLINRDISDRGNQP